MKNVEFCHVPYALCTYALVLLCASAPLFLPRRGWHGDLKKQSQFAVSRNDAKIVIAMVYEDFGGWGLRKNKANSKPIKANFEMLPGTIRPGGLFLAD